VCESANNRRGRWEFDYIRHHKETRNSRNIPDEERKRTITYIHTNDYMFMIYVSRRKKFKDQWALGWSKYTEHNYPPLADLFRHPRLRHRRPYHTIAITMAALYRGIIGAKQSAKVLERHGFKIKDIEFYNLCKKEGKVKMSKAKELELLIAILERNGFYPRVWEEYILENKERVRRVIRCYDC
jgi:hypothetical protein